MSFQSFRSPGSPVLALPAGLIPTVQDWPKVALVMPCYNEARRLDAPRIVNFLLAHRLVHLIFVNDGSTDQTLGLLVAVRDMVPGQVTVLDLAQNAGKAEAVRQGLLHALQIEAGLTGYWDADLATPLEALPDFARVAARYDDVDVVFGSRRRMLGHRIERSLRRRMISRLCNAMARFALGLPVADTQCGAKVLRRTDALATAIQQPFTAGWLFDVELFARIAATTKTPRRAFYELPLSEWEEIAGSNVTGRAVLRAGLRMLRLIVQRRLGLARGMDAEVEDQIRARVVNVTTPHLAL